jgi:hypothetical protein
VRLQDLAINIIESLGAAEAALLMDRQYDLDAPRLRSSLSSLDVFVAPTPVRLWLS